MHFFFFFISSRIHAIFLFFMSSRESRGNCSSAALYRVARDSFDKLKIKTLCYFFSSIHSRSAVATGVVALLIKATGVFVLFCFVFSSSS